MGTVRMRMRSHLLLLSLLSGDSLARYRDRNVFYIKPSRGSAMPSALVHNNHPIHPTGGNKRDMEFQLVEQNSLIPEIPDGPGGPIDSGLEKTFLIFVSCRGSCKSCIFAQIRIGRTSWFFPIFHHMGSLRRPNREWSWQKWRMCGSP